MIADLPVVTPMNVKRLGAVEGRLGVALVDSATVFVAAAGDAA